MDSKELRDRWDKLDDRTKVLLDKYPLVAVAVFTAGLVVGGLLGVVLG